MNESEEYSKSATWFRISDHYKKQPIPGMPKISIVVPTLNQGHVLEETLTSILSQKNAFYEIILIDAGSTDTTAALIDEYHEKITRSYFMAHYNLPLMINKGASLATGEYISCLFPGYIYLNCYSLCQISRLAAENSHPDLIYSADNHIEEAFKHYSRNFSKTRSQAQAAFSLHPFSETYLKRGFLPTSPFCMWFKLETFNALGELNHHYSFSKSYFDFLCRLYHKKNVRVTTTYWTLCNTDWSDKNVLSLYALFGRLFIIVKYFGIMEGLFWFFRDKPIYIISWILQSLRVIFRRS